MDEDILITAEAEFENALDDMYYGYGFDFWRTHYDNKLSDRYAKLVWEIARWVMTDDYFDGIKSYPTLKIAYDWKTNGLPSLDADDALRVWKKAEEIIDGFEAEAVMADDNMSVLVRDKKSGMQFWFDSWVNEDYHDINCDWNQSIFQLDDEDDVLRQIIMRDNCVFDQVSSEALEYQEKFGIVHQWEDGSWHTTPEEK